ncbi:hypothetical protein DY000_02059696 [Brassica cretica]|uniref:Uncharacterized protein n=1 Tax=Brassica cretica TaxID=69181 RepID=A0ABQ7B1I3_BRACR|nr:hypothetical protein DY000_02059696 [Brassica cretica]
MDSILTPIFMEMMNNSARIHPGTDMDSQLQEILRRRGRRPVSIEQLLQGIYAGLTLAPADDDDNNQERGRVIVTNPYNQIVAVPISAVSDTLPPVAGSLSEYFIGPEFEAMLERLTETDPRRYGTPPARRDALEALASVEIQDVGLQCSVYQLPAEDETTETNASYGGGGSSSTSSSSQGSESTDGNRDDDGDRSMLDPMEA